MSDKRLIIYDYSYVYVCKAGESTTSARAKARTMDGSWAKTKVKYYGS